MDLEAASKVGKRQYVSIEKGLGLSKWLAVMSNVHNMKCISVQTCSSNWSSKHLYSYRVCVHNLRIAAPNQIISTTKCTHRWKLLVANSVL